MSQRRIEIITADGQLIPLDQYPYLAGRGVALSGLPAVSIRTEQVVGMVGTRVRSRRHSSRELGLPIHILGETPTELDIAMARLARAVDGDVTVRYHRADGTAREINATYVDGFSRVELDWAGSRNTLIPLVFEAHDLYWRAVNEIEIDVTAEQFEGSGELTAVDEDIDINADIPVDGFNASGLQWFNAESEGDVESWPRFRIEGPASAITILNQTVGGVWSFGPSILAGDVLELDFHPGVRRVLLNDADAFASRTIDSQMWRLLPGLNRVGLRLREWQPGQTKVRMFWRNRYLTC